MEDELFQPTISKADTVYRELPWSARANFVVAFFGGVLATTFFSYLNGKRLKMTQQQLIRMLLVGTVGFVFAMIAYYFLLPNVADGEVTGSSATRTSRYAARAVALLTYFALEYLQKSPRRTYEFVSKGEHDSPWKMGLIAVFVIGTIQAFIVIILFSGRLF